MVNSENTFNPNEHLMDLQGKKYLEVKWRLVWFREKFPNGSIETEMLLLDLDRETEEEVTKWVDNPEKPGKKMPLKEIKKSFGFAVFRAVVKDGLGGIGTGTKSEKAASFPDYIEKAESGSIGRALAALGFGTQFTGDELAEHHRIVDAPVDRNTSNGAKQADPAVTAKLVELKSKAEKVAGVTNFASFYEWIGTELKKPVMSASHLTMDNMKEVQDRLFQLELQAAKPETVAAK
jgi:hypothetical protein